MASTRTGAKRRRLNDTAQPSLPEDHVKKFPNPSLMSASKSDRETWKGFCEIESDPV